MLTPASFKQEREHAPRLSEPYVRGRNSPRFWTDEQVALVRQHYPVHGCNYCVSLLAGKSDRSVYSLASKLGLKAPSSGRKLQLVGTRYDAAILEAWPGLSGRGAVSRLADQLGCKRHIVSQRALFLKLTMPHKKEPPWTPAEDELLRKAPVNNPVAAAKLFAAHGFRRSEAAIVVRCNRLAVSRRRTDVYSAGAAAKILGLNSHVISKWCAAGALQAERRGTSRLPQQGGDAWTIQPSELRRFVIAEIDRIDVRKVDKHAFVALLVGSLEPS